MKEQPRQRRAVLLSRGCGVLLGMAGAAGTLQWPSEFWPSTASRPPALAAASLPSATPAIGWASGVRLGSLTGRGGPAHRDPVSLWGRRVRHEHPLALRAGTTASVEVSSDDSTVMQGDEAFGDEAFGDELDDDQGSVEPQDGEQRGGPTKSKKGGVLFRGEKVLIYKPEKMQAVEIMKVLKRMEKYGVVKETGVNKERKYGVGKEKGVYKEGLEAALSALRRGDTENLSEKSYAIALDLLAKAKMWQEADKILSCMWFNGHFPNAIHYSIVMDGFRRAQRYDKATKLYEEMSEHNITKNDRCYNVALASHARNGDLAATLQVLQEMKQDGFQPSEQSYTAVFTACAQEGAWLPALQLFEEMLDKEILPSPRVFTHLITACGNGGQFDRAMQMLKQMPDLGVKPDLETFIAGMSACARAGLVEEGLKLFQKMVSSDIEPTERAHEALMQIALSANDPARALNFFDGVVEGRNSKVTVGPLLYRAALQACEMGATISEQLEPGALDYGDRALQLLVEMQEAGLETNSVIYMLAITSCERSGKWQKVITLLKEMEKKGMKVSGERLREAYQSALAACEENDQTEQAYVIYAEMERRKMPMSVGLTRRIIAMADKSGQFARADRLDQDLTSRQMKKYITAMVQFRKVNGWEGALHVLEEIREDGFTPTLVAHNTAISALQQPGLWELALQSMQDMNNTGMEPDIFTHTTAVGAMVSAGQMETAVSWMQHMETVGVLPNAFTYRHVVCAFEADGQWVRAMELWDEMRLREIEPDRETFEAAVKSCRRGELWEAVLELFGEMKELRLKPSSICMEAAREASERLGLADSVLQVSEAPTPARRTPERVELQPATRGDGREDRRAVRAAAVRAAADHREEEFSGAPFDRSDDE
ncbi:unnamed protein product [Polarella glacialis]|uniref:PROP1-like PPR domain-containing protein n=1 Tax=Polarella glacialis TaxID=89957 RepID=A0A813G0P1_POLGL|nr:unnamed protein product [Polarella glacialis]